MSSPPYGYLFRNAHRILARYAGAYALSRFRSSRAERKILVVKPDAVGDQVVSSFLWPRLRKIFPDHAITILVQDALADFYRDCPHIDRVSGFDKGLFHRSPSYALRILREVRRERYSVVLHAVYSRDPAGDQIATASGAPRIVGMRGDEVNAPRFVKTLFDRRYTDLVGGGTPEPAFEGHRYLGIPRLFGARIEASDWAPMAWIGERSVKNARALLESAGLAGKRFAILAPGAGNRARCWSASGFSVIGDRLAREAGMEILLAGAPGEEDLAERVAEGMAAPCRSLVGRTAVGTLAAIIAEAAILVGNESGPVHLAMAAGTPAVGVVGGGHFGRFLPYPGDFPLRCVTRGMDCFGCDWKCIHDVPLCVARVEPDAVWAAAAELLGPRA